jgi:hypothetical protein
MGKNIKNSNELNNTAQTLKAKIGKQSLRDQSMNFISGKPAGLFLLRNSYLIIGTSQLKSSKTFAEGIHIYFLSAILITEPSAGELEST